MIIHIVNLLGLSLVTDIDGTVDGTTTAYKVTIEVVKKGYTGLGTGGLLGIEFKLFIAIISISALAILRKRK
ncbi:MAG: hypothetical protein ACTSRU_01335 [Candidatus Hodarchaeales archaeon]